MIPRSFKALKKWLFEPCTEHEVAGVYCQIFNTPVSASGTDKFSLYTDISELKPYYQPHRYLCPDCMKSLEVSK